MENQVRTRVFKLLSLASQPVKTSVKALHVDEAQEKNKAILK
jgi:hypothetical protein